ncbi:hypothetical protein RB608_09710 [Nocardioides sp. LHD-245]|uniref:hypothetical protein n=1 Tax=Nocardioides sp. LHD-245 TaxID=3051387 RepID=UPI0027DF4B2D|nr:hypothetical protein [Nocardioides sp. LHD-245]
MHRTRLAALTTLLALIVTSLLLVSAPGGRAAAPRVDGDDVVTRADVVRAFPGLKRLDLGRVPYRTLSYYDGVCSTWERVDGTSGRQFGGQDAYASRSMRADVIQFRNKATARRLLTTFRTYVRDCGQHWAGVDTTVQPVRMPKFGDQRIGFRTTEIFAPEKNLPSRHYLTVAVRQGKRLLLLSVEQPSQVRKTAFVRLARVAARKMG